MTVNYICNTVVNTNKRSTFMTEPKFQITPKKYNGESSVVSMRMPKDMLKDIDEIAARIGRTRNEFMLMSLEFALEHLEIEEK